MYIWHHASYSFRTPWLGTWNTSRLRSAIKGTQMASESHKASDTGLGGGEEGGGRLSESWARSARVDDLSTYTSCVVVVAENRPTGLVEIYDSGALSWNSIQEWEVPSRELRYTREARVPPVFRWLETSEVQKAEIRLWRTGWSWYICDTTCSPWHIIVLEFDREEQHLFQTKRELLLSFLFVDIGG